MFKKIITSVVLGTTLIATAAQAHDGRRWNNPYRDRHSDTGTAVAAGAIGLILGLAIAGNNRSDDRQYDDPRYNPDDREYLRSRREEDYFRGGYYYYEGYYYGPRGYYYRDRYYDDRGDGYRRYWRNRR